MRKQSERWFLFCRIADFFVMPLKKMVPDVMLTLAVTFVPCMISCTGHTPNKKTAETDVCETVAPQQYNVSVEASLVNGIHTNGTRETVGGIGDPVIKSDDRLYVRAVITGTAPEKILAGYLSFAGTSGTDATSAIFSGDLSSYEWSDAKNGYIATTHIFNNIDDPFSECEGIFAMLVKKDADNFSVDENNKRGSYSVPIAADADTLITKCLEIFGWYDGETKCIALNTDNPGYYTPILNFSVSGGLTPNATYDVFYIAYSAPNVGSLYYSSLGCVTADANGKASFACFDFCPDPEQHDEIRFINRSDKDDVKFIASGMNLTQNMVYDITMSAIPELRTMALTTSVNHTEW